MYKVTAVKLSAIQHAAVKSYLTTTTNNYTYFINCWSKSFLWHRRVSSALSTPNIVSSRLMSSRTAELNRAYIPRAPAAITALCRCRHASQQLTVSTHS